MNIVIIKYNAGNVTSVSFALQRLDIDAVVTDDAEKILQADKIIFPGVGAANSAMLYLKEKKLDMLIKNIQQPFLGVCLGMQLLCNFSEEGNTQCIGVFNQPIKKFTGSEKVPQTGWNNIYDLQSPLFKHVDEKAYMYFVHSYYAELSEHTVAKTNYTVEYSSALQKDNFYAVQFHPEKSGSAGEKIFEKFYRIMIEIIPAIDLIDGKCVRLSQGDYETKKIYNESPLYVAKQFEDAGIKRLHIVDLDGARQGKIINIDVLKRIASSTKLKIDFGGGIKTIEDVQLVFDNGASFINIGSIGVKQPDMIDEWIKIYGAYKILLGADVKDEIIMINGWQQSTTINIIDYVRDYISKGINNIFCTDISKDGLLQGTSINLYKKILVTFPQLSLIASGGVSTIKDIEELQTIGCSGVIIGKALYEGNVQIDELKKFLN